MSALTLSKPDFSASCRPQLSWEDTLPAASEVYDFFVDATAVGQAVVWALLVCAEEDAPAFLSQLQELGAWREWPLMALTHRDGRSGGLQMLTREQKGLTPMRDDAGKVCGIYNAEELFLCGLTAASSDPATATRQVFTQAQAQLTRAGYEWTEVIRTWFYNRDILAWYDVFNRSRREYFAGQGVSLEHPPASTGIGLSPAEGGWLTLSLIAVRTQSGSGTVTSPLQGEAGAYGSFFSRAYEQHQSGQKRLWVSGTASINEAGDTVYLEDLRGQFFKTHEVVDALLRSRGQSFENVTRATAYVRKEEDLPAVRKLLAENWQGPCIPLVIPAVVCRDNLLYEIELETEQ